MKEDTLNRIRADFKEHPVMAGEPVPDNEIILLEQEIGFELPADYKQFVREFGGGIVGPFSVYGLRSADAMDENESSALKVTERFRADGWKGVTNWLIISSDHSENPVGIDDEGVVWISDHDVGSLDKLSDDFESYLREICLELED